ncbi:MAG: calcium-binding protein, partial [Acetobacteraceae bacterium]|nr:calcium-binding protein [Acetobacteraceae bacterium]
MTDAATALARTAGGIAVVTLENAGAATLGRGVTTLGQTFAQGEVPAGGTLMAQIGRASVPVQIDVKSTWPDGSVKMAILTLERPPLAAGEVEHAVFVAGAAPPAPTLDLASGLAGRSFTVTITPVGGTAQQFDVLQALRDGLADGSASVWQQGPLASQARVEILVPGGSQRLVFDVTLYKGGGFEVDAQFNNDRAMEAIGGRVAYDVTVAMDGRQVAAERVDQGQYQNWHREFSSSALNGGQGLGDPASGWLNIVHDVAKLGKLGVVPDYDLTLAIPETVLSRYATATASATWDDPLAANGVTQYMPMTGGRPDIGFTTQSNAAWLISGDARAAAYSLGQAEAAGAIPWHFYDAANGTWLNTDNYPRIWTDPRGGVGRPGDRNSTGLTQGVDSRTGWEPDSPHQPNLSFIPYVLTGERWMLDNLQAQASYNVVSIWPVVRQNGDDILAQGVQVRGAAWALRELEDAAWASPEGSVERAYFRQAADANWSWLVSKIPEWTRAQGEAHGWVPGEYPAGALPPWQQDFFASSAILAASRGSADALTFLNWQKNFLIGRFQQDANGFAFHDGAAYNIAIADPTTRAVYKTWAQIGAETAARGWSNGTGWDQSVGYYGQLALATLAGIYQLTGDATAREVYLKLVADNPRFTSADDFARDASFAVTLPGEYGWGSGYSNDTVSPDTPVNGRFYDLWGGRDLLLLPDGGNLVSVANAETITGGSGADIVTVTALETALVIDLGKGSDRLFLPDAWNTVTASNVERINGGSMMDLVTLATPADGVVVDLGGGNDQLTLSSLGPNRVTVRAVETVIGGRADDDVTVASTGTGGTFLDLGAGTDRVTLPAGGSSTVTVTNVEVVIGSSGADTVRLSGGQPSNVRISDVETIVGSWGSDTVTLDTPLVGGSIDLREGADTLILSGAGANQVTVANTEVIVGGGADDDVMLGATPWGARVDLGAGADRLTLSGGAANNVIVTNTETVMGGANADRLTFDAPVAGAFVDLAGGVDTLILSSAGTNRVTVRNVESITGGTRNDIITMQAGDVAVAPTARTSTVIDDVTLEEPGV